MQLQSLRREIGNVNLSNHIADERNRNVNKISRTLSAILAGLTLSASLVAIATSAPAAFAAGTPQAHSRIAGSQSAGAGHKKSWYAVFAGTWEGTPFGDTGACGTAVGLERTTAKQTIVYHESSENCAGFTVWGKFYAHGSYITTLWTACSPQYCTPFKSTTQFRVVNLNTIDYIDAGRVYQYHRIS